MSNPDNIEELEPLQRVYVYFANGQVPRRFGDVIEVTVDQDVIYVQQTEEYHIFPLQHVLAVDAYPEDRFDTAPVDAEPTS